MKQTYMVLKPEKIIQERIAGLSRLEKVLKKSFFHVAL